MIELTVNSTTGIIKTVGTGTWDAEEVDEHYRRIEFIIADFRTHGKPIRMFADVSNADIQSPEIEAKVNAHSMRLYQPGDRIALVVKSSILKAHVREAAAQEMALFCSHNAAETWLLAHDLQT